MASNLLKLVRKNAVFGVRRYASEVSGPSATAGDHGGGSKRWKLMTFLLALPGVAVCYINAEIKEAEHKAHHEREPFVAWEHMRLRTKKFPWGDGNHGLFHNAAINALPEGYEDEL